MFYVHHINPNMHSIDVANRIDYYLMFPEERKDLIPMKSLKGLNKNSCLVFFQADNGFFEINRRNHFYKPQSDYRLLLDF
jgi:hypothetical protein